MKPRVYDPGFILTPTHSGGAFSYPRTEVRGFLAFARTSWYNRSEMKNALCILTIILLLSPLPACGTKQDSTPSAEKVKKAFVEAVKAGDLSKAKQLLANGVDADARDKKGRTVLQWLLTPSTVTDESGSVTLIILEDLEPYTLELAKLLISADADVNVSDEEGRSLLHWAVLAKEEDIVSLLLENGADVAVRTNAGTTPLHWAARDGNENIATNLLTRGADVNAKNYSGRTPLYYACANGIANIVHLLVAKGADVNSSDRNGELALHRAAEEGHREIVELLFVNGSEVNETNNEGETPLDLAETEEIKKLLRSYGAVAGKELEKGEDE